jgi:hypothetical protein
MMLQLILTLLIITSAAAAAGYRIIRFFRKPPSACHGCEKVCNGCPIHDLRTQANGRRNPNHKEEFKTVS